MTVNAMSNVMFCKAIRTSTQTKERVILKGVNLQCVSFQGILPLEWLPKWQHLQIHVISTKVNTHTHTHTHTPHGAHPTWCVILCSKNTRCYVLSDTDSVTISICSLCLHLVWLLIIVHRHNYSGCV